MSANEHLEELAAELAGGGWRSKWPQEEQAAYDRTPWSEKKDWWEEMYDKPLPPHLQTHTEEQP